MSESQPRYGATLNDWLTLDAWHGLTADLLPVVSNPKAVIAGASKMRDKGKVPSRYNRQHQVAGFPEWTQFKASEQDIERWKAQPDYGICIQTRHLRALDIDIPDFDRMCEVVEFADAFLHNIGMPRRVRANSAKCLLAFYVEGDMPKRVIKVREKVKNEDGTTAEPAWLIEFLATGQQFIAAGTHSSGARITWEWVNENGELVSGMPDHFPTVTLDQFNALWTALEAKFACEPSTVGQVRKRGESFDSPDANVKLLDEKGLILGEGNDGQLFIECPWKGDHSMDSGITECAYFPRGSGGYDLGHFKCMHAGCATHSDTDFEEALGLRDGMFESLPVLIETDEVGREILPLPKFERKKNGDIINNLYNLDLALQRPDVCGRSVRFDTFRQEDTIALPGQPRRPMTDGDATKMRRHLERYGFLTIGKELMRDALGAHGDDYRFDSATEWCESLPAWDGKPRVGGFLHHYFGAEDTEYATAVSRYLWTSLAGRALVPGIKADMAVILQGEQGVIKSTAIAALVPWEELFTELDLAEDDDKLARLMQGKLIAELGELRGLATKDLESIKAFIVRRFDSWVPKFKERAVMVPRRTFLMLASENRSGITATEVAELHEEKLLMLGPVLERLHNELLNPLVTLTFEECLEAGILPEPPEELQGVQLNIVFISMLAQAQRAISTNATDRFVLGLLTVAKGKPSVLDKFDEDEWADDYADSLGINPKLIKDSQVVAQVREARAKAEAAAQQQQQMAMAAETAKTLGTTPTGGDPNALTDITRGFQGYT